MCGGVTGIGYWRIGEEVEAHVLRESNTVCNNENDGVPVDILIVHVKTKDRGGPNEQLPQHR